MQIQYLEQLEQLEREAPFAYFSSPRPMAKPLATCMSSSAAIRQNSKNESCSLNCGRLKVGQSVPSGLRLMLMQTPSYTCGLRCCTSLRFLPVAFSMKRKWSSASRVIVPSRQLSRGMRPGSRVRSLRSTQGSVFGQTDWCWRQPRAKGELLENISVRMSPTGRG